MRLRRIPESIEQVQQHPLVSSEQQALQQRGKWQQLFAAEQPLHLEIGMGRGRFLRLAAANHPEHNYLGMERRAEPMLSALERLKPPYPGNLRLMLADASLLEQFFAAAELAAIYLNFSDPWPKSRHAKRRLTAPAYLRQYQHILQPAGRLFLQTDGAEFYQWSCASLLENDWLLEYRNTNQPPRPDGAMSEYEKRFRQMGLPIYYAEFSPPGLSGSQ